MDQPAEPDYQPIIEGIVADIRPELRSGRVATYIPELARVSPDHFGIAVSTPGGRTFATGDATTPFSIQSISKLFTLTLAMQLAGDSLWERLDREPSGNPFNSLVQLERENGIPRNPFINAGALVITDVILSHLHNAKSTVLDFVRSLSGNPTIEFDHAVAASERATGHRNAAMAHFLKGFDNLNNDPDDVLDAYFHHCSIAMTCVDVANACLFLANDGHLPATGEMVVSYSQAKVINSLMLTCGTYDSAGDFAYRVGLPGKSGVGGGIVCTMPRRFAVCTWSPGLGPSGNSHAGMKALELFTTRTGISIF
ncbi:MAG: glutaminase [Dehalococcoidia bacterium]